MVYIKKSINQYGISIIDLESMQVTRTAFLSGTGESRRSGNSEISNRSEKVPPSIRDACKHVVPVAHMPCAFIMHKSDSQHSTHPQGTNADFAMLSASTSKRRPRLSPEIPLDGSSAMLDEVLTRSNHGMQQMESMAS